MPATFTIPSIFTAVDKFSGPMRNMSNSVQTFADRSQTSMARVERTFNRVLAPLTALNKMMMGLGLYVGLYSFIRLFRSAIDIIADFQQANANLATVMETTVKLNRDLALDARRIGLAYGKSAADVVKMQHELATLGYTQKEILNMGGPIITGAVAMDTTPKQLSETVGAVIQSFDNLNSADTQRVLDVMTMAGNRTALTFDKLATTLPIVSSPANTLNISFEKTVALLGILSNAGVHVATSATSLKNIFIDSTKKGHTYEQMLENIAKHADKLTYAYNKFGKRSVVSALVLSNKLREAKALAVDLENVTPGLTNQIAIDRLNTFHGSVALAKAAYSEFVLSIEDGTGKYAAMAQDLMKVIAAMLLLSSDSDAAREAIKGMDTQVIETAQKYLKWLEIIGKVTLALIAIKTVLVLWNAAVAIGTALMAVFEAAVWLWGVAVEAATFATWAWGVAIEVGLWPLTLMVGVLALIVAGIYTFVSAVKGWGEQWDVIVKYASLSFQAFVLELQLYFRVIEAAFMYMVEGIVMAWKWGQNLIGNLSDEQFAKDKARIAEERKLRMLAIKDNAIALGKATTAAQGALEWKLAFKTEEDQIFEDRYGEVGGGRPKINPREEERILRERYEEVQKMNMAIDVNTNTGQTDVRTKNFPDFISIKTSSTMGY